MDVGTIVGDEESVCVDVNVGVEVGAIEGDIPAKLGEDTGMIGIESVSVGVAGIDGGIKLLDPFPEETLLELLSFPVLITAATIVTITAMIKISATPTMTSPRRVVRNARHDSPC